ncbi:MAG: M20 family metallopeptidase [Rectinemataceae bacterium]|jgi:hippurate hydrolase
MKNIVAEARQLQEELLRHRRFIHENAELDMTLPLTSDYVMRQLKAMGYSPHNCGASGIVATVGQPGKGKVILLRADMDALPVKEDTDLAFKSVNGRAHACGHDLHTAMLLGAAKLLKNHESELEGLVKLMFQPGEEMAHGAPAMIEAGVLENPHVDAAMMIHVFSGIPIKAGTFIVPKEEYIAAACDVFDIEIQGKGGHGAMPSFAIDPLNIAVHTHLALQTINSREISAVDPIALTIGYIVGGSAPNVIPDKANLGGSVRTFDPATRDFVQKRLEEIATGQAHSLRGEAKISYIRGSPAFRNDKELSQELRASMTEMFGAKCIMDEILGGRLMGSEDFAFVSEKVPSVMVGLAAGEPKDGYIFPQHHPKIRFDENVLYPGAASFAGCAMSWLRTHSGAASK